MRNNAFGFTGFRLLPITVSGIGHNVKRGRIAQSLLCSFCHGEQTALVIGFSCNLLSHNQCVFRVNCRLHVISRKSARRSKHEACFRLGMAVQLLQGNRYGVGVNENLIVTIRLLQAPTDRDWGFAGVLFGIGFLNRHAIVFLAVGLGVGFLATRARAALRMRGPWIGAAIALGIALPHLVWQATHGWPTLEFLANARATKMLAKSPWAFVGEQILVLDPLATQMPARPEPEAAATNKPARQRGGRR